MIPPLKIRVIGLQGLSVMALQRYHAALFGESGALERGHLVGKIRLHWCGDAPKGLGFSSLSTVSSDILPRSRAVAFEACIISKGLSCTAFVDDIQLIVALALKLCRFGVGVETSPTLHAQPAFVDISLEKVGTRLNLRIATQFCKHVPDLQG